MPVPSVVSGGVIPLDSPARDRPKRSMERPWPPPRIARNTNRNSRQTPPVSRTSPSTAGSSPTFRISASCVRGAADGCRVAGCHDPGAWRRGDQRWPGSDRRKGWSKLALAAAAGLLPDRGFHPPALPSHGPWWSSSGAWNVELSLASNSLLSPLVTRSVLVARETLRSVIVRDMVVAFFAVALAWTTIWVTWHRSSDVSKSKPFASR